MECNHVFKILIVGDNSTGKTSMVKRYVHNTFTNNSRSTVGVDFDIKKFIVENGNNVTLQLWDIGGQERCGTMTRAYYRNAVGALIVFDLTRPETLVSASKWKDDINEKVKLENNSPIPVVLVGNKCDMVDSIDTDIISQAVKNDNYIKYLPVSAKLNINIDESMNYLVYTIFNRIDSNSSIDKSDDVINIDAKDLSPTYRCCT